MNEHIADLSAMDREKFLEFLLWHYRVVDAFWFIRTEENFGLEEAEKLNEQVWGKAAELAAKDIKRRFGVKEDGLQGFLKAFKYFPWTMIVGYDIRQTSEEVVLRVFDCPSQNARIRRGLGEYACKMMHWGESVSYTHLRAHET